MKNHETILKNHRNQPKTIKNMRISKNVTHAGSQMTWKGGRAGISKNVTNAGSQMTWEGGGSAGISKNVTHAGSQMKTQPGTMKNHEKP